VKLLEAAKFEAQKKMYQFVRESKVAPQMINAVIKVEKLKADVVFRYGPKNVGVANENLWLGQDIVPDQHNAGRDRVLSPGLPQRR
jgi:hypothetical protein